MPVDAAHRLLLVHAHPDDETINNGATMARYAEAGAHVTLVTCTRGEQGEIIVPELARLAADADDALGPHREGELAAAMAVLGVSDHRFLGEAAHGRPPRRYRDSGMVWAPDGSAAPDPRARDDAFALADVDEAAERLADVVRELRPQVLVTYEPGGGYGHPDHVQAHRVTMRAAELASAAGGAGGAAWTVPKIYWVVLPDDLVTTCLDGTAFLDRKAAAMRAHATQLTVDGAFFALSNGVRQPLGGVESYRLVSGAPAPPFDEAGRETELFAGTAGPLRGGQVLGSRAAGTSAEKGPSER